MSELSPSIWLLPLYLLCITASAAPYIDSDDDYIPDSIETNTGYSPIFIDDHNFLDADSDGYSNVIEFQAGSNIVSADSTPPMMVPRYFNFDNGLAPDDLFFADDIWSFEEASEDQYQLTSSNYEDDNYDHRVSFYSYMDSPSIVQFQLTSSENNIQDVRLRGEGYAVQKPADGNGIYQFYFEGRDWYYNSQPHFIRLDITRSPSNIGSLILKDIAVFPDSDEDYLSDNSDNCPLVPNADQEDINDNGIGDICESTDFDLDGDSIADSVDNCLGVSNYSQSDIDDDTQGDKCDTDIDGDYLTNELEKALGYSPYIHSSDDSQYYQRNNDYDGDTIPDRVEYALQTNPLVFDEPGEEIELLPYFALGNINASLLENGSDFYAHHSIKPTEENGRFICNNICFPTPELLVVKAELRTDGIYWIAYQYTDEDEARPMSDFKAWPTRLKVGEMYQPSGTYIREDGTGSPYSATPYTIKGKTVFSFGGVEYDAIQILYDSDPSPVQVTFAKGLGLVKLEALIIDREWNLTSAEVVSLHDGSPYVEPSNKKSGGTMAFLLLLVLLLIRRDFIHSNT